ncbi:hypothetical protein K469DRAFT_137658 [Zopfia rhizophila CBS 207.26]|uniref:Uncharacterized protein n=1 Tax=Zopfia rhizophila CBS 207.26 TaxID=1314779 RepID=A0A6A6E600_9PEZI|nr:hypothetical protein K469DRAFT_137658 [Zopfia rhizophila CBS 207.26]
MKDSILFFILAAILFRLVRDHDDTILLWFPRSSIQWDPTIHRRWSSLPRHDPIGGLNRIILDSDCVFGLAFLALGVPDVARSLDIDGIITYAANIFNLFWLPGWISIPELTYTLFPGIKRKSVHYQRIPLQSPVHTDPLGFSMNQQRKVYTAALVFSVSLSLSLRTFSKSPRTVCTSNNLVEAGSKASGTLAIPK